MTRLFFLSIWMLLFFTSFSQDKKFTVLASASMIADMTEVITGGLVDVQCIVPIGGDPHLYEPTPKDVMKVAAADLILVNGLTFEGWLNELIDNSGTEAEVVTITNGIQPITSLQYQNATDPHAWMDLSNGLIYIDNIRDALKKLDPLHTEEFAFNHGVYKQQMEDLDKYIFEQIQSIPKEKRILITSHDAFQYYGKRYGVTLESILGVSTDADVQTADVIRLNQVIRTKNIPAVFIESTINPKLLEQLAKDNNIEVGGQLFADSIGDKESPAPSYLAMLKHNTDTIVKALSKEASDNSSTNDKESGPNWVLYAVILIFFIGGFGVVFRKLNQS